MSELTDWQKRIDTAIGECDTRFTEINRKFDAQYNATEQILRRLTGIENRLKNLESQIRKP